MMNCCPQCGKLLVVQEEGNTYVIREVGKKSAITECPRCDASLVYQGNKLAVPGATTSVEAPVE